MARTIRPGRAPTYVRRWPRISASSRMPPSATRTNLRPRVRATDSPSEVLPTPGGPASRITAPLPRPPTTSRPRSARRARTARYSTIRSLTSSRPWWSASSTARAASRSVESSVVVFQGSSSTVSSQVRIHCGLGVLLAGALELVDLAQQRLAHAVGHVGRLHPGAVVVGAVGLALAELLADRGQLLAQQELALRLLQALAHVTVDLLGDLDLGLVLLGPLDEQLEPALDVGRLEQLALALVVQVRRPAGRVGDRLGVGERAEGVDDLPGLAALQLGDDQLLVLGGQLAHALGDLAATRRGSPRPTGPRRGRSRRCRSRRAGRRAARRPGRRG